MSRRYRLARTLGLLALALPFAHLAATPALAQLAPGRLVEEWAEVITVTPQWVVLQNRDGQQYPVSIDQVRLFVMRWPTSLDRISPTALVEATGYGRASNQITTPHVDVYEGAARGLVTPGILLISPSGQVSRPIDFLFNPEVYGAPFPGFDTPIQTGAFNGPQLTHVVGPMISRVPLMIAIGGNNALTVLPNPAGVNMTQITPGSISLVKPGDVAYVVATRALPESLVLDQMVVYKAMFIDQFSP